MFENPLGVLQNTAPGLFGEIEQNRGHTLTDGALQKKTKFIITLALDASHGAIHGVTSLGRAAIAAGATKTEITEALRVDYFIGGAGSIYTVTRGL